MIKKPVKESPTKSKTASGFNTNSKLWTEYALVGLTILLFFFLRKNFVGIAFERDEGAYAMIGQWLLTGARPYVDFYEMKPPGLFLMYALVVKIFGYDYRSLQFGFCFINALTLFFSYLFFKKIIDRNIAIAILPVFGFLLLNQNAAGFTTQSENLVLLFVCSGLYFFFYGIEIENNLLVITAGALLCFSVLIKQVGVFYCLFALTVISIYWWKTRKYKKALMFFFDLLIGALIPLISIVIWLISIGVFKEALFWIIEYPEKYYLNEISFL